MEVIPIPFSDQQDPIPNVRIHDFFVINARLDTSALKNGLEKLIREHWRKLGARIVRNLETKRWEYHLPETFADNYDLFKWSQEENPEELIDTNISLLQTPPTDNLTLLAPVTLLREACQPADWPHDLADDPPDSPMLYIHISIFSDASVLAISFPHILGDQIGLRNFMRAWLGVVDGISPPPMVGYYEDPLPSKKQYTDYEIHEVRRKGKMRVRWPMEYFFVVLGFIFELIMYRKEVQQTMFFPHSLVKSLRHRATKEIEDAHGKDPGISDGDIITAVLAKLSRLHKKRSRMMTLSQTVNLRGRIPQLSGPAADSFIHNGLIHSSARFRMAPNLPMSEIAYQNRIALLNSQERGEPEKALAIMREMVRRRQNLHNCEPLETSFSITNWCAAWRDLNFSAAVEKSKSNVDGADTKTKTLKPRVFGTALEKKTPHRLHSVIMCRTDEGYWCDVGYTLQSFKVVKDYLAKDPHLEEI